MTNNPAYPNGQCFACGFGLSDLGQCTNRECCVCDDYDPASDDPEFDEVTTYKIKRFRFQGETTIEARGLTLAEAQEWCSREDTHGDGWFDGYEAE